MKKLFLFLLPVFILSCTKKTEANLDLEPIKKEVLKMLLFLPLLLIAGLGFGHGVESGWIGQIFVFSLLLAFFCILYLIQYLIMTSYLSDLSNYRLFWKYINNK